MIALDTNVIIHFLATSSAEHQKTKNWFDQNKEPLATTNTNIAECLRLLTHPKVFEKPLSLSKALTVLEKFLTHYDVLICDDQNRWWQELLSLEKQTSKISGNEIFDARIALCLKFNGIKKIFTRDSDFKKFPFLKVV
ncbi:MAG: PIN domain-containing protein [Deltaproteobacteria bacterium]|nr:PIN domain-containing protein [Deltaproteobacteria bacterium]